MDGWSLASCGIGALLACAGLFISERGIRRALRHADSMPHYCPACAYELAGLRTQVCPECGMDALAPHIAARVRATIRAALPAAAGLIIAAASILLPIALRSGPLAILPTSALIAMMPWAAGEARDLHDELLTRLHAGELSENQGTALAARCDLVVNHHALPERRAAAAAVLAASSDASPATAAAVASGLRHADEAVRLTLLPAAARLAGRHPCVREALCTVVADDASELARARAVDALRRAGTLDRTSVSVLCIAATSQSPRLRQRAIYAIGARGPSWTRSRELCSSAVNDGDAGVREAALAVLSDRVRTDAAALPILTRGLTDPSPELRSWTAAQLRLLGAAAIKAVPALFAAATDSDTQVRIAAEDAIHSIVGRSRLWC